MKGNEETKRLGDCSKDTAGQLHLELEMASDWNINFWSANYSEQSFPEIVC